MSGQLGQNWTLDRGLDLRLLVNIGSRKLTWTVNDLIFHSQPVSLDYVLICLVKERLDLKEPKLDQSNMFDAIATERKKLKEQKETNFRSNEPNYFFEK